MRYLLALAVILGGVVGADAQTACSSHVAVFSYYATPAAYAGGANANGVACGVPVDSGVDSRLIAPGAGGVIVSYTKALDVPALTASLSGLYTSDSVSLVLADHAGFSSYDSSMIAIDPTLQGVLIVRVKLPVGTDTTCYHTAGVSCPSV